MKEISYTLLSEGTSDTALLPIITWLLRQYLQDYAIQPDWADLQPLDKNRRRTLADRILASIELYPCNLLFVHRDADREPHSKRVTEIRRAVAIATRSGFDVPAICVIPVRMTEAWLLFNENAIRMAAENPRGRQPLPLPTLHEAERAADPKALLMNLLQIACDLRGRQLRKAQARFSAPRVAREITDFSPLRHLAAFQLFEEELKQTLTGARLIEGR